MQFLSKTRRETDAQPQPSAPNCHTHPIHFMQYFFDESLKRNTATHVAKREGRESTLDKIKEIVKRTDYA